MPGHVRAWYVVHACDCGNEASHLVDGQLAIGMKPYLLGLAAGDDDVAMSANPASARTRPQAGSLLTAWNEVREWRKLLTQRDLAAFDLVHAHSFSAGMAAVRNCPTVVYDIRNFVESRANTGRPGEFTWLARSFRVAEQFVIARAGAVVVHSYTERQGVLERGGSKENLFQVPAPLAGDWVDLLRYQRPVPRQGRGDDEGVSFFAPDVCLREEDGDAIPAEAVELLEAFARVCAELSGVRLFVQADAACVELLFEKASALGITRSVHAITSGDREQALAQADVIIAVPSEQAENTVLTGLLKRRAVLAADAPVARDASADGRGVLWYRVADIHDLARRAAFLAANPDFRMALAESGRKHLLETRTPEAVACRYDAVYRHAWNRRRSGTNSTNGFTLQAPSLACL
jgi:hypothetical protein